MRRRSAGARRTAAAAVLVSGWIATLALNWPGQLSYDSVAQLHDGRTGHYNAWHPLVMAWMLGIVDSLVPGTGLFVLFDASLLFGALLSLLWLTPRVSWAAVAGAAMCVALPQLVLYQGIVWKDVLFADASIAGFVALAQAGVHWRRKGLRWSLVFAAFLLLVLATLARQNGAIALAFGAVALAFVARNEGFRWRSAFCCGIGAAAAAACVVLGANLALAERSNGVSGPQAQIKLLQLYDLIGEAKTDPGLRLDGLKRANADLDLLIHTDGVRLYTPVRNDTLVSSSDLQDEFADTDAAAIASQWRDALVHHPWDYLSVRARVFAWVFFTPDLAQCDAYYTGVDGPPQYLRDLGLRRNFRPQDRALGSYAALFIGTPVFSHAAYALIALVLLAFLLRRRHVADFAIACLLGSALAFTISFFLISIACDYRYLLFLDLAVSTAFLYCVLTWHRVGSVPSALRPPDLPSFPLERSGGK